MAVKSFITLAPSVGVIKSFFFVVNEEEANSLLCLSLASLFSPV